MLQAEGTIDAKVPRKECAGQNQERVTRTRVLKMQPERTRSWRIWPQALEEMGNPWRAQSGYKIPSRLIYEAHSAQIQPSSHAQIKCLDQVRQTRCLYFHVILRNNYENRAYAAFGLR